MADKGRGFKGVFKYKITEPDPYPKRGLLCKPIEPTRTAGIIQVLQIIISGSRNMHIIHTIHMIHNRSNEHTRNQ